MQITPIIERKNYSKYEDVRKRAAKAALQVTFKDTPPLQQVIMEEADESEPRERY